MEPELGAGEDAPLQQVLQQMLSVKRALKETQQASSQAATQALLGPDNSCSDSGNGSSSQMAAQLLQQARETEDELAVQADFVRSIVAPLPGLPPGHSFAAAPVAASFSSSPEDSGAIERLDAAVPPPGERAASSSATAPPWEADQVLQQGLAGLESFHASPEAAEALAERLSAILEDPHASIQDILATLDSALPVASGLPQQQKGQQQQQQQLEPPGALQGRASLISAASAGGSSTIDSLRGWELQGGPSRGSTRPAAAAAAAEPAVTITVAAALGRPMAFCGPPAAARPGASAAAGAGGSYAARKPSLAAAAAAAGQPSRAASRPVSAGGEAQRHLSLLQQPAVPCQAQGQGQPAARSAAGEQQLLQITWSPGSTESVGRLTPPAASRGAGGAAHEWQGADAEGGCARSPDERLMVGGADDDCGGGEAWAGGGVRSSSSSRPLRDTPEWDARLQQLYCRNVSWRRRCKGSYERQRAAAAESELQGCTFAPAINQRSVKLAQQSGGRGYPMRPVRPQTPLADEAAASRPRAQQQQQRPASTGRMSPGSGQHQHQQRQHEDEGGPQLSPEQQAAVRAAAAASAVLGEEAGRELMRHMLGSELHGVYMLAQARRTAATGSGSCLDGRGSCIVGRSSRSPERVPAAARRLYEDASVRQQRRQQTLEATQAVERRARAWSAPRCASNGASSRAGSRQSSRGRLHQPTGLDECSFRPQTNKRPSKFPSRPSTAPGRSNGSQAAAVATGVAGTAPTAAAELAAAQGTAVSAGNGGGGGMLDAELLSALDTHLAQHRGLDLLEEQLELFGVSMGRDGPGRGCAVSPGPAKAQADPRLFQQQQPGSGAAAEASLAAGIAAAEACSPAPGPHSPSRVTDELDWDEFIRRQDRFLELKAAKAAHLTTIMQRTSTPKLSPGTKRILQETAAQQRFGSSNPAGIVSFAGSPPEQQQYAAQAGSPSPVSPYLARMEQQQGSPSPPGSVGSPPLRSRGAAVKGECTFRPVITRRAASLKGRPVEDMSEGDRLRREAKQEHMRLVADARSLDGVTFAPDLSPSRVRVGSESYDGVPARISLRGPGLDAYMASLERVRQQLEDKRQAARLKQQTEELQECTFKPATTPLPEWLRKLPDGYTRQLIETEMTSHGKEAAAGAAVPAGGLVPAAPVSSAAASSSKQPTAPSSVRSSTQLTPDQRVRLFAAIEAIQQHHSKIE